MKLDSSTKLLQLFDSETFSDFTVTHRGQSIHLHRCILLTHSSYFETLFMGGYADSDEAELDLSNKLNIPFRILRNFFGYFYGGSLDIDHTNCYLYFYCSRYFIVDSVRTSCLNYLSTNKESPHWLISWSSQASFLKDEAIYKDLDVDHQQSLFLSVGSGIIEVRELERLLTKVEAVKFPGNCWDKAVISIVAEEPQLQSYFSNIISTKVTKSQQESDDVIVCAKQPSAAVCTDSNQKFPFVESYGDFLKITDQSGCYYVNCISLPFDFCSNLGYPFHPKASINVKPGVSFSLGVYRGFLGVIGQWNYHDIESKRSPIGFMFSNLKHTPSDIEHRCTIVVPGATDVVSAPSSLHFKADRQFPNHYKVEFDYSGCPELRHMSNFIVEFSLNSDFLRIWFEMKKTPNSYLQILPFRGSV
ncbi:hypothetical protein GEMRC1_009415 [Eukaryota sp. GEM-RC1]